MAYPTYDQELAQVMADLKANIVVYNRAGQRIPVDMRQGSVLLALARRSALLADTMYGLADTIESQSNIDTAEGIYLDRIGAQYDAPRETGSAALWPMRIDLSPPPSAPYSVSANHRIAVPDSQGNLTMLGHLPQGASLPNGTGAVVPAGKTSYWVFYVADNVGEAGNIGANQIVASDPLAGVSLISNPQVPNPGILPVPTQVGSGSTYTLYLAITALGLTGETLISPARQVTNANVGGLDATHGYILSWPDMPDAVGGFRIWSSGDNINWTVCTTIVPAGSTSVDTRTLSTWVLSAVPPENTTSRGVGGVDAETDERYRSRIKNVLAREAFGSGPALVAAVESLTSVKRAYFLDVTPSPGSFTMRVLPFVHPLSAPQQTEITNLLDKKKSGGITAYWSEITATLVTITYAVQTAPGTSAPTGYIPRINTAIEAYMTTLELGAPVRYEILAQTILSVFPKEASAVITALTMVVGGTTYGRGQVALDVPANPSLVYNTDDAHIAATVA